MTPAVGQAYAPVVFLDTNAVQYAKLVLTFGTAQGVDILSSDWLTVRDKLKAANLGPAAISSYETGYWILRYLVRRSGESAEIYYSPITRLELLCGSLRGDAIKRAANSGVPNRWYSRMEEDEIRLQLEPDGYDQVKLEQENVEQQFDQVGIVLNEQELEREVWQLARTLLENIFVDVQDCLVYASAFLRQANELITSDGPLRRLVGYAHNPGSAPSVLIDRFNTVKSELVAWYAQMSGWDEAQVILPQQRTVSEIKQLFSGGTP